jgi:hypothetical protein
LLKGPDAHSDDADHDSLCRYFDHCLAFSQSRRTGAQAYCPATSVGRSAPTASRSASTFVLGSAVVGVALPDLAASDRRRGRTFLHLVELGALDRDALFDDLAAHFIRRLLVLADDADGESMESHECERAAPSSSPGRMRSFNASISSYGCAKLLKSERHAGSLKSRPRPTVPSCCDPTISLHRPRVTASGAAAALPPVAVAIERAARLKSLSVALLQFDPAKYDVALPCHLRTNRRISSL